MRQTKTQPYNIQLEILQKPEEDIDAREIYFDLSSWEYFYKMHVGHEIAHRQPQKRKDVLTLVDVLGVSWDLDQWNHLQDKIQSYIDDDNPRENSR